MPISPASLANDSSASLDRFRVATDISSDAMFLIHRASLSFLDVNRTACRLLGFDRDELLQMGPMRLSGRPREYHEQIYDALIEGREDAGSTELTIKCRDGKPLVLDVRRCAQQSDEGWLILAIARDVSELRQAREQLAQASADLTRLSLELQASRERERSQLATRLHGDLGQLLAALRINLTLLQQQNADAATCSQALASMDKLVVASISSLRQISAELKPKGLADGDLQPALQALRQTVMSRHGMQCELLGMPAAIEMDEEHCIAVYRMLEELAMHILPAAGARSLAIEAASGKGMLTLILRSDAPCAVVGGSASYRLAGIREQIRMLKGTFRLTDDAERSCRIEIVLPL